jgi:uncharacterized membrane protein
MNVHIAGLALLIGMATGLRTMTGLAVISWAAHTGWIHLENSRLAFLGSLAAVVFLTAGAIAEFIADKLPRTGKRTAIGPLVARMISGGACGVALCLASDQSWAFGAAWGVLGAIIGSFGGYFARAGLVRKMGAADISIALLEDVLAVGSAVLALAFL